MSLIGTSIDRIRSFVGTKIAQVGVSGGKDSTGVLELVKESGINYIPVHNLTTIDSPETLRRVRKILGVVISRPIRSFWQDCLYHRCLPNRQRRFCCETLKEKPLQYGCEILLLGIRNEESKRRSMEPMFRVCKKRDNTPILHPIIDWTTDDVVSFLSSRGQEFTGCRTGCVGCPLASREKRIAELDAHPAFRRFYIRLAQRILEKNKRDILDGTYRPRAKAFVFKDGQEMFDYWMEDPEAIRKMRGQMNLEECMEGL